MGQMSPSMSAPSDYSVRPKTDSLLLAFMGLGSRVKASAAKEVPTLMEHRNYRLHSPS